MSEQKQDGLYFFWERKVTEQELRQILQGDDLRRKAWAVARILEAARWEDKWKYLTIEDVREMLPHLKMRPGFKDAWEYAVKVWTHEL